jgi:hypothetical protein
MDMASVPVPTARDEPVTDRPPGVRTGRRRAAEPPGVPPGELPEHVTDLLFALRTRPWLFLDVVDLVVLTDLSRAEVSGGLELLSGTGLVKSATRGNRVCYAAVP